MIYDSLHDSVDPSTAANFERLFNMPLTYKMADTQKQQGRIDCGVFSIANATTIALCADTKTRYLQIEQKKIRKHLAHCLQKKLFNQLPA